MSAKDIIDIIATLGVTIVLILVLGGDTIVQIIKTIRGRKDE